MKIWLPAENFFKISRQWQEVFEEKFLTVVVKLDIREKSCSKSVGDLIWRHFCLETALIATNKFITGINAQAFFQTVQHLFDVVNDCSNFLRLPASQTFPKMPSLWLFFCSISSLRSKHSNEKNFSFGKPCFSTNVNYNENKHNDEL